MYKLEQAARNLPKESLPELLGGIIVNLIALAVVLAVPVLIVMALVKIVFF